MTISAGTYHACARLVSGTVECWGRNDHGELGNGTKTSSPTAVAVSGITNAIGVSAIGEPDADDHTCALLAGGTIECWGYNDDGELGNGTTTDSTTPVQVSSITNATQVSAGGFQTCALLSGGTVECWGYNYYGELGNGTKTDSSAPVQVSGITNAIQVSAGGFHTCAVLSDHTVECWGSNAVGELGDGTKTNRSTPVKASGITTAVAVSRRLRPHLRPPLERLGRVLGFERRRPARQRNEKRAVPPLSR